MKPPLKSAPPSRAESDVETYSETEIKLKSAPPSRAESGTTGRVLVRLRA